MTIPVGTLCLIVEPHELKGRTCTTIAKLAVRRHWCLGHPGYLHTSPVYVIDKVAQDGRTPVCAHAGELVPLTPPPQAVTWYSQASDPRTFTPSEAFR